MRVGFLQLRKHFLAVLGLLQFTLECLNLHKDLVSKRVIDDVDDLLKDVVTKDMSHKFTNNQIHTRLGLARAITELVDNCHVIPKVGAQEDLGNLHGGLRSLKSLLNHIGGELELAESDEVSSDKVQDLLIHHLVVQFNHILNKIVSILVFDHVVESADNDLGKGHLLRVETLLKTSLHHTASVLVSTDLVTADHAGLEDEVGVDAILLLALDILVSWLVRGSEHEQELLNHMVSIGMGTQVKDTLVQLSNDSHDLMVQIVGMLAKDLNQGLDYSSSVVIHADLNESWSNSMHNPPNVVD